jgi:hypothetical protein
MVCFQLELKMNKRIAFFTACLLFSGLDLTADDLPVADIGEEIGKIPSIRRTCVIELPGRQIDCHDFLLDHVDAGGSLQTASCINLSASSCNQTEIQLSVNVGQAAPEFIMVANGLPGLRADRRKLPCVQKVTCVFDSVTGDCRTDFQTGIDLGPDAYAINGQACIGD